MQLRFSLLALLVLSLAACSTEPKAPAYKPPSEQGLGWRLLHPFAKKDPAPTPSPTVAAFQPAPKRSWTDRILHPFAGDGSPSTPRYTGIKVTIEPDSAAPSLRATSQLGVRVLITNYTSTLAVLTFPTSQRVEIVGRNLDGKIFYTSPTDRGSAEGATSLTVNPGERLEYSETIPTRSMSAGNSYLLSASVVGQIGMEGSVTITPTP